MKKSTIRFYIEYYDTDRVTYEKKLCIEPRRTKAWRTLKLLFNTDPSITGIGYEPLNS